MLSGGWGDDQVFGENYGEMTTLVADGDVAEGIKEKGDLAPGSSENHFVFGSKRDDGTSGGEGEEQIVGRRLIVRRKA